MRVSIPVPRFVVRAATAALSVVSKASGGWFAMGASGSASQEASFSDAYSQSLYAAAGINKIGRNLASGKLEVHADEKGGSSPIEDPAILAWKAQPAKGLKWSQFIEATNIWLKSRGKCFWLMGDEWLIPHLELSPPPLILANADRMRAIKAGGELIGWSYIDDGGRTHALLPENVIQHKYYNPADPHDGLSPLQAGMVTLQADFYSGRFFKNAMKSNGEKGSIIVAKSGVQNEPQKKQIEATIRQHARLRAAGDISPMFFSGDVEVKDPQVMPIDASFFEGCKLSGEKIFLLLDLPPSMASTQVSNSIGSASDFYRMLTDAVIPTGDLICDGIDSVLTRLLKKTVFSSFNFNDHPVMQEVREGKTDTAVKFWGMGMPFKDVSEFLGLGAPRFDGDDVGMLPFSVAPVGSGDLEDPASDPDFGEESPSTGSGQADDILEDEDVKAMFKALESFDPQSVEVEAKAPKHSKSDLAAWSRQMRLRKPHFKKHETAFKKELLKIRSEVLSNIERAKEDEEAEGKRLKAVGNEIEAKGVASDLLFNTANWRAGLLQRMRGVAADALKSSGEEEWDFLGQSDPFKQAPAFVSEYLRRREPFIAGMANTVIQDVTRSLARGVEAGESMAKLAGRVRSTFNKISKHRGRTIAQTEVGTAYEEGRSKAMKDAGVEYKKWLESGNSNVRASHHRAHGQIKRIDEPFTVGGHQMMRPLDGSLGAPAGEIINCYCTSIAVRKPKT